MRRIVCGVMKDYKNSSTIKVDFCYISVFKGVLQGHTLEHASA